MSNSNTSSQNGKSTRGGTPEQHAKAGRQSHKNDDKSSSASKSGSNSSGSNTGGKR